MTPFPGPEMDRKHALTVLGRLAARRNDPVAVEKALGPRLERLAELAVEVAVETGGGMGPLLARLVADRASPELAERLKQKLAEPRLSSSVALSELAVEATRRVLEHRRAAWPRPDESQRAVLAELTWNLGCRLIDVRRLDAALVATRSAVASFRRLARRSPGVYDDKLAHGLNNLGNIWGFLGEPRRALPCLEEAVSIYRRLSDEQPELFLGTLTGSLDNLGNVLHQLGHARKARTVLEEALRLFRRMPAVGSELDRTQLAGAENLAVVLLEAGEPRTALRLAREAVELDRENARELPDVFLPNLATSLFNLSGHLEATHRLDEAVAVAREAVDIRRRLAADRPETFGPSLAAALDSLAALLGHLGRADETLALLREALSLFRYSSAEFADLRPRLAMCLNNLGYELCRQGLPLEGYPYLLEARDHFAALAGELPNRYLANLAIVLGNLGECTGNLDRWSESCELGRELVRVNRQLVRQRREEYLPGLADSLHDLGALLIQLECWREAADVYREAVRLYRPLSSRTWFEESLIDCLAGLHEAHFQLGRTRDAWLVVREIIRRLRTVIGRKGARYEESDLADFLAAAASDLCALERPRAALAPLREAIEIYMRLVRRRPEEHAGLAEALRLQGEALLVTGRADGALESFEEGLRRVATAVGKGDVEASEQRRELEEGRRRAIERLKAGGSERRPDDART